MNHDLESRRQMFVYNIHLSCPFLKKCNYVPVLPDPEKNAINHSSLIEWNVFALFSPEFG
uniref:Uncharacterized protein n=1 Tax=Anguilla anguilla TaxID=7936 RepID=A0A0E9WTT5_ANGAN